jgi:HSP20 family protein
VFDIDRIFEEFFGDTLTRSFGLVPDNVLYPRVDIVDNETSVSIEAEIPGLTKEDVSVEIEDSVLVIKGSSYVKDEDKKKNYIKKEIKRSSFARTFNLSSDYDIDKISADFDHGILKIDVPKKEEALQKNKKRKIL